VLDHTRTPDRNLGGPGASRVARPWRRRVGSFFSARPLR
jgi:hypothetical protein